MTDLTLTSWLPIPSDHDFSIHNFPFGIIRPTGQSPRVASALGDFAIDLLVLQQLGLFNHLDLPESALSASYLNDFIALGKAKTNGVRKALQGLFVQGSTHSALREQSSQYLLPIASVEVLMPVYVRDYTDFYSSREHATNVGTMFRDPDNALLPNWLHLPVGYHGRASSIVVSGTDLHRPSGQLMPAGADAPVYGTSRLLDFELEMAFIIGKETNLGESVRTDRAEDHIFGMVLFNDWSARDIQKWEYVPLGPFLGKSFGSTVSPWVVTLEALDPFRIPGPIQDPSVLPYLQYAGNKSFDIHLQASITPESGDVNVISNSNFKYMYWNMAQQLAHHTVNGCNINIGDMMASGTISGPTPDSYGSMLELSWRGTKPLRMSDGTERKFLQDGDTLTLRGWCEKGGARVGFGEAAGKVLPARQ